MIDQTSRLFDEKLIARRRLRKWVVVVVGALLVVRLGAEVVPTMRRPDLSLLDLWQGVRGTGRPSPQVVIVALDEKSIQRFGPPAWPRSQYVPLIERLSTAGARVIGFDFTFGALEREAANNELLAAAMKRAGNVVFGYEFTRVGDPTPPGAPPLEAIQANALPRFDSVALPPAAALIEPEPVLAAAAAALGHVWALESEDGRIRTLPLLVQHGGSAYPSLALQIAQVYTATPRQEVELRAGAVRMGEWDIPVSPSGEVLLNWPAGGEQAFPQFSFLDVVRGDIPDQAFAGKAVLVAGTAPGLDDRDFPFALEAPGVLAYAAFLDNVFRADFVQAPMWAWLLEWGLFLAVSGLVVWLLPRLSTPLLLAGVPLLALLMLGGAAFAFVQQGVWIKTFYPVLALLVPLGLVVALRLTASERQTRDVAAEKVESQKLLGLSFQEKGMLDMALATFNKLPFTDDLKLVYLNLGLDYENRGQRDKAYLVYKKVHDIDPGFEDIGLRIERLSQAGTAFSVYTGAPPRVATPPVTSDEPTTGAPGLAGTAMAVNESATERMPTPLGAASEPFAVTPAPSAPAAGTAPPGTRVPGIPATGTPAPATAPTPAGQSAPSLGVGPAGYVVTHAPGGPVMPGSRFGRYEVERHLGRGGMGDVYLVRDIVINRRAALKTIRPETDLDPSEVIEMRQRFYREAQTAGKLTHPNIVTIYDVGEDLGMSYIVMEFVEGHTLAQWMKQQRFSVAQIKHVVFNAAMGLDYAHSNGVFHRDVKPDNVMVSPSGLVKVMDFGIARVIESTLTRTGNVIGTPAYMSPEQVSGQRIDGRSDVFSLGVILYELLTGKKPFTGETIPSLMLAIAKAEVTQASAVDAKVDASWDAILRKALAKNPDERFATAKQFAEAVRDAPAR
jgi:CHASE2 domain-containing sensor protein/tRNA A-37 threonylcarbamoyl transferase component Bud32